MTTTSELRSKLENNGEEISRIAHQIEDRLGTYKDWQGLVREYPLQSLGVAAGLGLLLSGSAGLLVGALAQQVGSLVRTGITASIVSAMTARQLESSHHTHG